MSSISAEIYIDIKEAAQILNNVSIRTAYRYIAKGAVGVSINTTTDVASGFAIKLYRKEDILTLARALNKDRTILSYVPVNVRSTATPIDNPTAVDNQLANGMAETPGIQEKSDLPALLEKQGFVVVSKSQLKIVVSTLIVGVLILLAILSAGGYFLYQTMKKDRASIIEALKTEFRIARLAQEIESKL